MRIASAVALGLALGGLPGAAGAAEMTPAFDGYAFGFVWALPFAGLLLSIAVLPLAAPALWHHHHGKIAAFWALAFLVPCAAALGLGATVEAALETLLAEYLPFVLLLLTLFTVAGGIRLRGRLGGTPGANTALLAGGTLLASIAGTTGAAVLLVRPLIGANLPRRYRAHVFVWFIFLVGNIGGALTPLGDPPLFLGFLSGVPFFWPTRHLLLPMLAVSVALLVGFYLLDSVLFRRESRASIAEVSARSEPAGIDGAANIALLAGVIGAILLSGLWHPGITVELPGVHLPLEGLVRDGLLLAITAISLRITHATIHEANGFSWFPMAEVAKLFAGIFIAIIPAIAMLRAGRDGPLGPLIAALTRPDGTPEPVLYFWLTGALSSVLDNAPTYLMMFHSAGGDPAQLTGPLADTLTAISAGAVFMGANTYIGNAPNLMVRSICVERGIGMPSFFAYIFWAALVLVPLYAVETWWFFGTS